MKEFIYILGTGRSGTTLVDIVLGNSDDIFSAGELNRFPRSSGVPSGRDSTSDAYLFWKSVSGKMKEYDYDYLKSVCNDYEYHTSLLRKKDHRRFSQYQSFSDDLLDTLAGQVKEQVIVDSSKYPLRLFNLCSFRKDFKYCIYVKKHPVSILRSFRKKGLEQPAKSWFMVNIYLISVHLISRFVIKRLKKKGLKVIEIRFEEFTKDPRLLIDKIDAHFGIDMKSLKQRLASSEDLDTNYLFQGNRIRLKNKLSITEVKPPTKWTLVEHFVYVCNRFWWKK